ncbi:MAG: hypothetical protein ACI9EF_000450 [Pseudohongiellaceae bacterium]|jgi:hypothetical protein
MSERRLLVLGAGQRVKETILPAVLALKGRWALDGVFARSEKTIESRGVEYRTESFDDLDAARLAGVDLVYLCVAKHAVPAVLRKLVGCDPRRVQLLIETPVLLFKQLGAYELFGAFDSVFVSEDTSTLPWMTTLRDAEAAGLIGAPQTMVFDHSAWRYHGLAMTRTVLQCDTIVSAKRVGKEIDKGRVVLHMANGSVGEIVEPRDYSTGSWQLRCGADSSGKTQLVTDAAAGPPGSLQLIPMIHGSRCHGFRLGDVTTALDERESELLGDVSAEATTTALTHRLKAVGLMTMLVDIHEGRAGYPLALGLDDMMVDYLLEKFGRWRRSPLTSLRSGAGRALLPRLLKLASRS